MDKVFKGSNLKKQSRHLGIQNPGFASKQLLVRPSLSI